MHVSSEAQRMLEEIEKDHTVQVCHSTEEEGAIVHEKTQLRVTQLGHVWVRMSPHPLALSQHDFH